MPRFTSLRISPTEKFGLDRREAAAFIGVTPSAFDALVASGDMPQARRFGTAERWLRVELERSAMDMPAAAPKVLSPYAAENVGGGRR